MKAIRLAILLACSLLAGCSVISFLMPEGPPSNQKVIAIYRKTELKQSTAADVLTLFDKPKYALLSQSKSIIALAGQKRKGYMTWFNMVSFDENSLIAKRKYAFISDEKPKQLFAEPWEGVDFRCQMILSQKLLDEPYANENARRIAILKEVERDTRDDTAEVGADNEVISEGGMITGQGMANLLTKLDSSPALARGFSDPNGLEFEEVSFDKGRLRMIVEGDIVTVRLQLGSFAKRGKLSFEGVGAMED